MGAATRIAGKDLKLRVRDRSAFIMGIVTPLALAYIFHLVFGGTFSEEALDLEVGLVDLDHTQVSQSLGEALSGLEAEGILVLTDFDDAASAEASVEEGEIGAYILLNQGLGDAAIQAPAIHDRGRRRRRQPDHDPGGVLDRLRIRIGYRAVPALGDHGDRLGPATASG